MVEEQFAQQPPNIEIPRPDIQQQSFEEKKSNWKLWLFIGLGTVILISGILYFFLGFNANDIENLPETMGQNQSLGVVLDENCDAFTNNLNSCTKYKCQFTHPFTGELMIKEILGISENKCGYVEEMPNNGEMNCEYTEDMRKAAAQYYVDLESGSFGVEINGTLGGDTQIKYTIDGKEVDNPLQEALDNGQCTISGY